MSAIAEILHAKGYTVQGSDQKDSANVKRLRAKGIRIFVGHDAANLVWERYIWVSTFIKIPSQIGVVTNIDPEHLDYFKTVENMHREFETFYRNIPFYGLAVACIDHPVIAGMIERLELRRDGRRLLTYGTTSGADLV